LFLSEGGFYIRIPVIWLESKQFYYSTGSFLKEQPRFNNPGIIKYEQTPRWEVSGNVSVNILADKAILINQ
jgi:hypothetical protein